MFLPSGTAIRATTRVTALSLEALILRLIGLHLQRHPPQRPWLKHNPPRPSQRRISSAHIHLIREPIQCQEPQYPSEHLHFLAGTAAAVPCTLFFWWIAVDAERGYEGTGALLYAVAAAGPGAGVNQPHDECLPPVKLRL